MALYDSPVYRASQDLTQTLLGIARLNQLQKSLDAEERDRARADQARNQALGVIDRAGRMPIAAAPPGPATGGAPFVAPLQDASTIDTTPQPLDYKALLSALVTGEGVKMFADPQVAAIAYGGGLLKSPEQVKLEAQRADLNIGRPARSAALQALGRPQDKAEALAGISSEDMSRYSLSDTREQNAETARLRFDLSRLIEALQTPRAQQGARESDARIGVLGERQQDIREMRPFRQESLSAGAEASRARAAETTQMLPSKVEGQQKRNEQIGKVKPTVRDQDVQTYMRQFEGMPDAEIEAAIADAPAGIQAKMRAAKQALFDQRRQEILSGAGRTAGQAAPSGLSPAGQRYLQGIR